MTRSITSLTACALTGLLALTGCPTSSSRMERTRNDAGSTDLPDNPPGQDSRLPDPGASDESAGSSGSSWTH